VTTEFEPPVPGPPLGPVAPVHPGAVPSDPERPEGAGPAEPRDEQRWKPWSAWLALLAGFAGALFGGVIVSLVGAAAFGVDLKHAPPSISLISTVVQDLSLIVSALLFANMVARPKPWQFGLRRPPLLGATVGWFVLAYVSFIVFAAVWISALDLSNTKDSLPDDLGAKDSDVALIAVALLVCVIAPICEEFFFRGFFFRALSNWRGVWPAAIVTGLVFGGIHAAGSPVGFLLPLAFLGFALCLLTWKTRSLYPAIVLHCVNNSLAYGSAVGWSTGYRVVAIAASLAVIFLVLSVVRRVAGPPPGPPLPIAPARHPAPRG
jgi:membrane protease YdiL (CAAX protease family)